MREISYAGGSFVTSDEIAFALLEYAAALANAERAATVHVPAAGLPGEGDEVAVLVGPSSQLMAEPVEGKDPGPDGARFLSQIDERMKNLQRTFTYQDDGSVIDWDI